VKDSSGDPARLPWADVSPAVREFARQPALDGVRAIAVALVLLFHQGWMSGGYVGVSVFFTLSGYLITSLALVEHDRTGRLDVGAFYGRRIKRLLPASLACLVGIVALALTGVFDDVEHLRRDLWGALAQVYNWVALGGGQTYAEMVGGADASRSPLDHYWSLAIEEQFYWVWPLVLVVVLRRPVAGRRALIAAGTLVFAVAAPVIAAVWGADAAYWATPARLAEILVGALLGVMLHGRTRRAHPPVFGLLAPAGLAVIVWAAVAWPRSTGPAYSGWLPVFALASVALIAGLQVPSWLRTVLSCRPLVVLGALSYGVYLVHWPVFVVLDAERTRLPTVPLFALRLVVTFALAVVSFRRLESPVRRARPGRLVVPVGAVTASASVAVLIVVAPTAAQPYWMTADAAAPSRASVDTAPLATQPSVSTAPTADTAAASPEPTTVTTPAPTSAPTPAVENSVLAASGTAPPASAAPPTVPPLPAVAPSRPVRILVVGDSTAMATAKGLEVFDDEHADLADVVSMAEPGCGVIPDGTSKIDTDGGFASRCRDARAAVATNLSWLQPDVVMGMVTLSDIDQRTWDAAEGPLGPADPRFYDRLVAAYDAASVAFLGAGATDVVWVAPPVPDVAYGSDDRHLVDPARYTRYADALREVAARHPGQVTVADLAGWLAAQPPLDRPDGLHWSPDAATQIANGFLGPVLVGAALT
jgi:peptidoglycan/LPS O-acetylase OafA/YrhL